jgi:hypothetical protein
MVNNLYLDYTAIKRLKIEFKKTEEYSVPEEFQKNLGIDRIYGPAEKLINGYLGFSGGKRYK